MSSLKDIMDDVDVLDPQAYRRSKEAALSVGDEQQLPRPLTISASEILIRPTHDSRGSKPPAVTSRSDQAESAAAIEEVSPRQTDTATDKMDLQALYQAGPSSESAISGSRGVSRGSDSIADMHVKYTPVTGRISKAKKGVPVHTCVVCRPVKTFSRAEHLRRHQLSHQQPAFRCTFCERIFHRQDLLSRHLQRHETQGVESYQSGAPRSGASSSTSRSRTPSLTAQTLPHKLISDLEQTQSDETAPPKSTAVGHPFIADVVNQGADFRADYILSISEHLEKKAVNHAQLSDTRPHRVLSDVSPAAGLLAPRPPFDGLNPQINFGPIQNASNEPYIEKGVSLLTSYNTTPALPLLRIPDDTWVSAFPTNSPWCSSASDSTQSEPSRNGSQWDFRGRSASVATLADWSGHGWISHTQQDLLDCIDVPLFEGLLTQQQPVAPPVSIADHGVTITSSEKGPLVPYYALDYLNPHTIAMQTSFGNDIFYTYYWQMFHPLFPIIHKPTFDVSKNQLLSNAMVAIGTRYHNSVEARRKGADLHLFCKRAVDLRHSLDWNDDGTLQAVLLTEIFDRFRGLKITASVSQSFSSIYQLLLEQSNNLNATLARLPTEKTNQSDMPSDSHREWNCWIRSEARCRLLNACFIFDIHQSTSQQQPTSQAFEKVKQRIQFPCHESVWNARNPSQWKAQNLQESIRLLSAMDIDKLHDCSRETHFTQCLILSWYIAQNQSLTHGVLDVGQPNLFLDRFYLAVLQTPLRELLAVSGDTWVYSKKVTPPSAFHECQARLKSWSTSLSAARATYYACQFLSSVLRVPAIPDADQPRISDCCLSESWSIYVSGLIIWAFGHRKVSRDNHRFPNSSDEAYSGAMTYIETMLSLSIDDYLTSKATIMEDTALVVEAVRQRLEVDSAGNMCGLLVDGVGVLGRIQDAGKGRWF